MSVDKIKLKFIIIAFGLENKKVKKINITNYFDGNLTLNEILRNLYRKYSNYKIEEKDLELGYSALICSPNLLEINYKFKYLQPDRKMFNYGNISIKDLEKQFNIRKKIFEVWLDPNIGDVVGRCRGIHFVFHTNERDLHHRPHIHCKYASEEFRVDLFKIEVLDKGFKDKSKTKTALKIIKINQKELLKYWNKVVIKGEKVKFNMYVPN